MKANPVILAAVAALLAACGGSGGGSTTNKPCEGGACVVAIAATSEGTSCALLASGGVKCWGHHDLGQLGTDAVPIASTASYSTTPIEAAVTGGTALSVGQFNGCATVGGGAVRCWGDNSTGQLGVTTPDVLAQPRQIQGVSGATRVAIGSSSICAQVGPNAVKCWGWNGLGQLGNGTTAPSLDPVDVGTLHGVTDLVAGEAHVCVLGTGGAVTCWGDNFYAQLGNSNVAAAGSPDPVAAVTTISGATQIAGGDRFTCVLVGGAVKCWGAGEFGQLGASAPWASADPMTVASVSGATAIAAGRAHACAIVSGGRVKCWGANGNGQLGNGSTTGTVANGSGWRAEEVAGLAGASAISAGNSHTCALLAGSGVKCWGDNRYGQLGDGTRTERHAPVDVAF